MDFDDIIIVIYNNGCSFVNFKVWYIFDISVIIKVVDGVFLENVKDEVMGIFWGYCCFKFL